jgi:hypothetical protein
MENCKKESSQNFDNDKNPNLDAELEYLLWIKNNTKSVESIIYPDGTVGELRGNFMVIL